MWLINYTKPNNLKPHWNENGESVHCFFFFFVGYPLTSICPTKRESTVKKSCCVRPPWVKLTVISLISSAVGMVLKSAGFSQLLSKQLVFMATWQTSPVWRMSPRLQARTYILHDADLPFKDTLTLFSVRRAVGFLHSSPVSDYPLCLLGNACTQGDRPGVDSFFSFFFFSWWALIVSDHVVKGRWLVYLYERNRIVLQS